VAKIVLWLFVINLGIAFGAGLYEGRIVVPQWFSPSGTSGYRWNAEAARRANVGLRFWVYVTTVPLTLITANELDQILWQSSLPEGLIQLIELAVEVCFKFVPRFLCLLKGSCVSRILFTALSNQ
jgi:hypothetical protein